jgi:hypothetical protein
MKVTSIEKCVGEDVEFEGAEHEEYIRYTATNWAKHIGESIEQIYFKEEYEPLEKAYNEHKEKEIVVLSPTTVAIEHYTTPDIGNVILCPKSGSFVTPSECMQCGLHVGLQASSVVCGYTKGVSE